MYLKIKSLFVCGTFMLLCVSSLYSQSLLNRAEPIAKPALKGANETQKSDEKIIKGIWFDCMVGNLNGLPSLGARVNVDFGLFVSAEYFVADELCFMCGSSEEIKEYNVLIGKRFQFKYFSANLSVGAGVIYGEKDGRSEDTGYDIYYRTTSFDTKGISVNAGLIFGGRFVGIGLNAHGNINKDLPVYGLYLNVPFGGLRPH